MNRLLITGANGQLGNEFRQIARLNNDYMFFFTDVTEQKNCHTDYLDITDKDAVYNYVKLPTFMLEYFENCCYFC